MSGKMISCKWKRVHLLFELGETSFVQVYPLCCVTDSGVPVAGLESLAEIENKKKMILLEECSENHKKAKGQVDIQGLHVRYLWQGPKIYFKLLKAQKER